MTSTSTSIFKPVRKNKFIIEDSVTEEDIALVDKELIKELEELYLDNDYE